MNGTTHPKVAPHHLAHAIGRSASHAWRGQSPVGFPPPRLMLSVVGLFLAVSAPPAIAQVDDGRREDASDTLETGTSSQQGHSLSAGSRVRVLSYVPGMSPAAGEIVQSDSAFLHLRMHNGQEQNLSWDLVRAVQVVSKPRSYVPALAGILIGGAVGFYLHKLQLDAQYEQDAYNGLVALVQGAPFGAAIGFVVGFGVGQERWRTVGPGPFLIPSRERSPAESGSTTP